MIDESMMICCKILFMSCSYIIIHGKYHKVSDNWHKVSEKYHKVSDKCHKVSDKGQINTITFTVHCSVPYVAENLRLRYWRAVIGGYLLDPSSVSRRASSSA